MFTFVTMGDSFTEGLCDDLHPDGRHLGWADRVARGLAEAKGPIRFANLGVRGKLIDQVIAEQVSVALAMQPDLATFHAGPNDILRPWADSRRVLSAYEETVGRLQDAGIEVVLFTSLTRAGGSGRFADRLEARFEAFNLEVRRVAAAHGCLLVDNAAVAALSDRRFWAPDRLHLTPAGHRRVAANVLHALGVDDPAILDGAVGWWEEPLPPAAPGSKVGDLAADARWVGGSLLPWIGRRLRGVSSGDGIAPKDRVLRSVG